jgi:hypothetical protein
MLTLYKKGIVIYFIITLLAFSYSQAQNSTSFYSFNGFHLGITGQAEYIQKCTFVPLTGSDPSPKPRWTYGWETGIEFSYHFAKYFGVSLGMNLGTVVSYNYDIYRSTIPDFQGGWKVVNKYDKWLSTVNDYEVLFPLKLEFHYPLGKNLFFNTEIGAKIKGVHLKIRNRGIRVYGRYSHYYEPFIKYYESEGYRYLSQIHCDLLVGVGLYYALPYGDLLRFNVGVNVSFKPIIEGYYHYFLTDSYGTFSVKNDFIYTQLSYIHTFNWQKARIFLKKNDASFASKKERRKKIVGLLNF